MSVGSFFVWPKKVVCGSGSLKTLGSEIMAMGKSRVMVFTDRTMKELPLTQKLVEMLKKEGLTVSLFTDIDPNPSEDMVSSAVTLMKEMKPEVLVAFGGGSSIDLTKAANVVYTHGGVVSDYDVNIGGIQKITNKLLPLIAVPTTAGTGSEVTNVSVITDPKTHRKYGVLSPLMVPDISLLDAEVTLSLPAGVTASTGGDALAHLVESYTSIGHFPPADALALHGIKMVSRSLRTAVFDGQNIKAREDMIMASMMAGTAFTNNGLGVGHATAHQLSSFFDAPHGLACAVMLPHALRFNMDTCPQRFADVAEAMGADISNMTVEEAAEKAVELVEKLISDIGIPKYLDDIGATKDKIPTMVEWALIDPPLAGNPKPVTAADIEKIYLGVFR